MSEQHPAKAEVVAKAWDFYWAVARWAADNPGSPADTLGAALDVELDDIIRRVEAVRVCEFCECPACRCEAEL